MKNEAENMLEKPNLPDILPARDIIDGEYLTEAEGEIRGYGRLVVSGIVAIGKKLSEVRTRVGHGKYGEFIKRLGFSHSTAQNFVQSYELLTKFVKFANLRCLQIDATALYLLARPSTSDEVRTAALEKAATEGISHAEVQQLVANAKAETERKTKEAVDADQKKHIAALEKQVKDRDKEIAEIHRKQAEPKRTAAEKAGADAKDPSPPLDARLPHKAMKARHAILYCIGEIELSPGECIAVEVEVATRLLRRPEIARENLREVAAAVELLSSWCEKFIELYKTEIGRDDASPGTATVEPTEGPPASSEMSERSASPADALQRYQREQHPPPKRGRGRPLGSRDTRPRKTKNTLPPIGANQPPDFAGKHEIDTAQVQTLDSVSTEAEMPNV
jgi:hypothetical protein